MWRDLGDFKKQVDQVDLGGFFCFARVRPVAVVDVLAPGAALDNGILTVVFGELDTIEGVEAVRLALVPRQGVEHTIASSSSQKQAHSDAGSAASSCRTRHVARKPGLHTCPRHDLG